MLTNNKIKIFLRKIYTFLHSQFIFTSPLLLWFEIKMIKIIFLSSLVFSGSVFAQCVGSDAFSTCTDQSGNTYQVQRYGNTTHVNGTAANGVTWNQTTNTYGNQSHTTGTASNGNTWTENRTDYGNGNYNVQGTNSNGEYYSHNCNRFGCN